MIRTCLHWMDSTNADMIFLVESTLEVECAIKRTWTIIRVDVLPIQGGYMLAGQGLLR